MQQVQTSTGTTDDFRILMHHLAECVVKTCTPHRRIIVVVNSPENKPPQLNSGKSIFHAECERSQLKQQDAGGVYKRIVFIDPQEPQYNLIPLDKIDNQTALVIVQNLPTERTDYWEAADMVLTVDKTSNMSQTLENGRTLRDIFDAHAQSYISPKRPRDEMRVTSIQVSDDLYKKNQKLCDLLDDLPDLYPSRVYVREAS
jgi:hypothetical protein